MCNQAPQFTNDMDGLILGENTRVGTEVYELSGFDPEGSPVKFQIQGTDKLSVDEVTGRVTLVKPLDYEVCNNNNNNVVVVEGQGCILP